MHNSQTGRVKKMNHSFTVAKSRNLTKRCGNSQELVYNNGSSVATGRGAIHIHKHHIFIYFVLRILLSQFVNSSVILYKVVQIRNIYDTINLTTIITATPLTGCTLNYYIPYSYTLRLKKKKKKLHSKMAAATTSTAHMPKVLLLGDPS